MKGTLKLGIYYSSHVDLPLIGYSNFDWVTCGDDHKATTCYVVYLGTGSISWCSKKKSTIALSTTKAEYTVTNEAAKQITWL